MAMLLASSQRHFVLLNTVFGQLWREIVVYLKDWSVCMNFANALSQFTNKKPVIVNHYRERQRRAAICAVVTTAVSMAWMRSRKEELPEYSISDRQFSEILGRLERYPKYVERRKMWTNTIISYLISQSQSIPQRRARLEEALSQEGLELRKDSQFCKEFIEKPLCIEVEEVVAIMEITSDIFSYGHIAWSNLHSEMEVAVLKQVFENGMGWMEAVRAVTTSADYYKKVQRESEKRGRDDDDEDDYFDWERGGRSRGRWY
ncbi:hypothetical protein BCR33DRAFT_452562 [Rhizoclosmatium globosum]|uniref:Uncharacterized protein n=1 Tax=Rhizoclosmatium globosum TaxID=329046 RepID=A0A1Y2CWD9_9FUNG|nr:hypothetical protein BCR33DRAFT_452562 [Rhizoclosmatium globosum]|eukprot:ORY51342.1 hypothetical protein BCR33DRAFT_452562 [Rhizoclosmatium globosum]